MLACWRVLCMQVLLLCDVCRASGAGEELACTLSVINTGTVDLQDLQANNTACVNLSTLAPGESANCTVTLTAQQADFDAWDAAYTAAGTSSAPLKLSVIVSGAPPANTIETGATGVAHVSMPLVSAPAITVDSVTTNKSADADVRAGGCCIWH